MSEWKEKVVIITGASSGIGAGIAHEFAKQGACLALVGRNETKLKDIAATFIQEGTPREHVLTIIAEMRNDEDVKNIVKKTVNKFGKINVLVNNAGISKYGTVINQNMTEYDDLMNINVRSVVLLTKEAIPYLIETKGNIVNMSSVAALKGGKNFMAYSMTKSALDHFTRCCALDLAPKGVRINAVQPGIIDTPLFETCFSMSKEQKEKLMKLNRSKHPMGRIGTVEDVSRAVLFLASELSSFTTGQFIAIDGSFPGTAQ